MFLTLYMSDASDIGLIPIPLATDGDDATWQDAFAISNI